MHPPSASLPSFPALIFFSLPNVSTQTGQSIWQPACAAPWSFCKSLTSGAQVIIKAAAAAVVLCFSVTLCCSGSQLLLWRELRCASSMWWNVRKMDVKQADKQVSFTLSVIKTFRLFISWIIKTRKSWKKYLAITQGFLCQIVLKIQKDTGGYKIISFPPLIIYIQLSEHCTE